MIQTLSQHPILLLFIVASLGYLLGTLKFRGNSLGVAAVLFTGLAIGTIDSSLKIPEIIFQLGLAIFIYSIGLSSGPAFFKSYKTNGFRDIIFIIVMLLISGLLSALLFWVFDFSAGTVAGIYSGSTTNTAALAGVIDYVTNTFDPTAAAKASQDSVVGYSYSYPMGVIGAMLGILLFERIFKIDYNKEKEALKSKYPIDQNLERQTFLVNNPKAIGKTVRDLFKQNSWNVAFGRVYRKDDVRLVNWETTFEHNDIVMGVGSREELEKIKADLGDYIETDLTDDRSVFRMRRIFVSNSQVAGRTIASLNLNEKYNAAIMRLRRGDQDMLVSGDTVLEIGDRVRFIAKKEDLAALSSLFGDSYYASSKVNLFSFGLGIGLGLILGNIEFSLGPDISFKLGYAGGPLIVGLILGSLRRTGPILWTLPYGANVTLQQIGLILLLATIGIKSGNAFIESFTSAGFEIFLSSAFVSLLTAFLVLSIGYKLVKIPFSLLMGMVANQPAILDFAMNRSKNELPTFGYAMMFPIAIILKIVIAQFLFILLN